jgi:hypothetical protein
MSGSIRIDGLHWHVWRARGPIYQRQIDANRAGCVAAVEQHLNSVEDTSINYATALVAGNASSMSRAWARSYVALVAAEFGIRDAGIVLGPLLRGEGNLKFYSCPAMIAESGFVSNKEFADRIQSGEGIDALARVLVDSICGMFPDGGLISLSVGHLYKGTGDTGAPVNDEGDELDPAFDSEGELNNAIINAAEEMLLLRLAAHDAPTDPAPPA